MWISETDDYSQSNKSNTGAAFAEFHQSLLKHWIKRSVTNQSISRLGLRDLILSNMRASQGGYGTTYEQDPSLMACDLLSNKFPPKRLMAERKFFIIAQRDE